MSEILCKCGAMRMLDPSVSCSRAGWIHAVSKCEPTCVECISLRRELEETYSALELEKSTLKNALAERDLARKMYEETKVEVAQERTAANTYAGRLAGTSDMLIRAEARLSTALALLVECAVSMEARPKDPGLQTMAKACRRLASAGS